MHIDAIDYAYAGGGTLQQDSLWTLGVWGEDFPGANDYLVVTEVNGNHYPIDHYIIMPDKYFDGKSVEGFPMAVLYQVAEMRKQYGDVAKFLDRGKGVADIDNFDYQSLLGVDYGMDKRDRILTHASGSTHAMTLIAVDIKDGKPVKWMVENSWGETSGYKGNIIMTDEWFDNYMFRLVVEKKYVPGDVLSMMNQKPVLLPAWDPMFAPEE